MMTHCATVNTPPIETNCQGGRAGRRGFLGSPEHRSTTAQLKLSAGIGSQPNRTAGFSRNGCANFYCSLPPWRKSHGPGTFPPYRWSGIRKISRANKKARRTLRRVHVGLRSVPALLRFGRGFENFSRGAPTHRRRYLRARIVPPLSPIQDLARVRVAFVF